MPYLVRKLLKRDQLSGILDEECVDDICADIPTNEFRTKNGTLSAWCIKSPDNIDDAVLAIAVTSSKISKMDFIIIDTQLLEQNGLKFVQSYAGIDLPIQDLQDTHYDITDITLKKLSNCAMVYKSIYELDSGEDKYIRRFTQHEIKEKLIHAFKESRIDKSKVSKPIREIIDGQKPGRSGGNKGNFHSDHKYRR